MKLSAGVLLGLSSARELAYYAEEVKNMHLRNTRAIDCSPYMVNGEAPDAVTFLKRWNDEAQEYFNKENVAAWEQATNITDHNLEQEQAASKESAAWTELINGCAVQFFKTLLTECENNDGTPSLGVGCKLLAEDCEECDMAEFGLQSWTKFKQYRGLKDLQDLGSAALGAESADFAAYQKALGNMGTVYSSSTVKDQHSDEIEHPLDPDLTAIFMDASVDPVNAHCCYEKQKFYWNEWNTEVGTACKDDYEVFVEMSNKAAELNGYTDTGDSWRSNYEDPNFQKSLEDIWTGTEDKPGIKSLYEKIHGYMRWKLNVRYGDERVSMKNDPIPEHIFGNMWAQTWGSLYDIAVPFPNAGARPDATPTIKDLTAEKMFDYADEFFVSLGMTPMTKLFWRNSVIEKRQDVEAMVCHASAWDFMAGDGNHDNGAFGDYRIKQCTVKNQDDFVTIHHEMGHIQYYQQYAHHPIIFRSGGNPGFHEAIGDTLALAVSTPKHLQEVGLLGDVVESDEADMNYLMSILLDKITFLPFGYLMDLYRWDIFKGDIPKEKYQEHWDKLRLEYQGFIPPMNRKDADGLFDAAGKYHIPNNTPYIRYFVSFIVQFQFYEKMCIEAGQYDPADLSENASPLYKCDFFNSIKAGDILKKAMQHGRSQPWQATLDEFLCENGGSKCDGGMSQASLLKYFEPIEKWLDSQQTANKYPVGWDVTSTWKPCGYDESTPECEIAEPCSEAVDWDESWGAEPEKPESDASMVNTLSLALLSVLSFVYVF